MDNQGTGATWRTHAFGLLIVVDDHIPPGKVWVGYPPTPTMPVKELVPSNYSRMVIDGDQVSGDHGHMTTEATYDPADDAWATIYTETFLAAATIGDTSLPEGDHAHVWHMVIEDMVTTYRDNQVTGMVPWVPGVEITVMHHMIERAFGRVLVGPGGYPIEQRVTRIRIGATDIYPTDDAWDDAPNQAMAAVYRLASSAAHDYYDVAEPA